jgi:MoaA/NifB/PqqE/SkfB family radical SAM enzyme/glycosyltransferase involved in cell wall biosynthesis
MEKYKVSVIVPAYNASLTIGSCIESLLVQTEQPHEIIIVNDASTDNTAEIIQGMNVRFVDRKQNGGAGAARAEGAKIATGDILAFTDSDCVVPSNWVTQIHDAFVANPDIGGIGGIYKTKGDIKSAAHLLCFFEEEYIQFVNCKEIFEAHPPGGNMAYLKDVWDKGRSGLELQFFQGIASGEDTLVSNELRKIKKIKFLPSLCIEHSLPDNAGAWFRRHINRGFSRMTLMANQLTDMSDMQVKCLGGMKLLASTFFLFLALLSVFILPFSPLGASVGASLFLLAHIGLSQTFFNFIQQKRYDLDENYTLTWVRYLQIRWLLLVRTFCWSYGGLLAVWRYLGMCSKQYWNVIVSTMHFWNPGKISRLFYFVTSKCNARCDFCFNLENVIGWETREEVELTLDEIRKIARNLKRLPYLTMSGGEPFMRKDLVDILQVFHEEARTQWVTIPSNGAITENTLRMTQEVLTKCPTLFLTIQISIDSLHGEHDESRKMPGGFLALTKTLQGLSHLRGKYKNLRIQIATCYDSFNVQRIPEIVKFCQDKFKYDQQIFYLIRETGELIADENKHLVLPFIEHVKANDEREFKGHKKSIWSRVVRVLQGLTYQDLVSIKMRHEFLRPCYATEKFVTLYDNGDISPCEVLEEKIKYGNIKHFNYDYYQLKKEKIKESYQRDIVEKKCNCEWMCAVPMNMLYDPGTYFRIIRGLISPEKIFRKDANISHPL